MADTATNKSKSGAIPAAVLPAGTMIGKYRVDARISSGGMATLYRGYDTLLERPVALKQIGSNYAADPRWCDRFRKEAQVLARLTDARNVVKIYELIENEAGLFLVLEYVDGHTLDELLARGRVGVQAALEIIWQVALGLRSVHGQGIIHRDIKPSNILVPPNRKAKITDFGVAAHRGGRTSMAMGTTRYMAPELFGGGEVDGRCDIYSLGFVGFEMLVGRKRFAELFADVLRDPRSESLRWMNWHTRMDAVLPRIEELNPEVPPLVCDMIAKMTAKRLADRYASIEHVIADMKEKFAVPRGTLAALASRAPVAAGKGASPPPVQPSAARAAAPATAAVSLAEQIADETPTAMLPQAASVLSRYRKPLLYGAAVLMAVLVFALGWFIHSRMKLARIRENAGIAYTRGMESYNKATKEPRDETQFAVVVQQWEQAVAADPRQRTKPGQLAHQYLPLAQAYLALHEKRWGDVRTALEEARRRGVPGEKVQAVEDRLAQDEWIDTSVASVRDAIQRNDFAAADRLLHDIRLRAPEYADLGSLDRELAEARTAHDFNTRLATARDLLGQKKFDEAREALARAQECAGEDKARNDRLKALRDEIEAGVKVQAGESALALDDYATAVARFDEARKLRPSKEVDARYNRARARLLVKEARELKIEGDLRAALDRYKAALAIDPSLDEPKREVERLARIQEYETIVREADTTFQDRQYARAIEQYKKAHSINASRHIEERIRECQFRLLLAEGDGLRDRRQWAEAEAKYREAEPHGSRAEVDAKLDALRIERDFVAAVDAGDSALAAKDFRKAKQQYEKARSLKPGPETDEKLKNLDYVRYVDLGDQAMAVGTTEGYNTALMWYGKARDVRDTDEIRQKIAEAGKKKAGG